MAGAAIGDLVRFFRDYVDLCLSQGWPQNDTLPEEIRNVFLTAQHIERVIKKLSSERHCLNEFLSVLNDSEQTFRELLLEKCMADPPKFILKKIINSEVDISQVDIAFEVYQSLFSQDRLIRSLSDSMVEAASKETLLHSILTDLPQDKLLQFKNKLYLLEVTRSPSIECTVNLLKNCYQELMDILVKYMIKNDQKISKSVQGKIREAFKEVMGCRDSSVTVFWKLFFNVDKTDLIQIFLKDDDLCDMAFEALRDSFRNIFNDSPPECNYIEFSLNDLMLTVIKIGTNQTLRLQLMEFMKDNDFIITENIWVNFND